MKTNVGECEGGALSARRRGERARTKREHERARTKAGGEREGGAVVVHAWCGWSVADEFCVRRRARSAYAKVTVC